LVAFGYRYDEIRALQKVLCCEDVRVSEIFERVSDRPCVAVSLGMPLIGSLLPHADPSDAPTLAAGVKARMGKIMPIVEDRSAFLAGLRNYTVKWIQRRNIKTLGSDFDYDFESWLAKTNYPLWRKDQLRKYEREISDLLERNEHGKLVRFIIKLFMKDEHYIDFKHARGIFARDDAAKITFGPWFKGIEEIVYDEPEFIKHVPVRDRASYIYERLFVDGSTYVATDFSSFEAHFVADLMDSCEFVLYEHMLGDSNAGKDMLLLMKEVLMGENRIFNKYVNARCIARRMSGEMNTSLGNGFSNLMFMGYVCETLGLGEPNGVVEGDDGLFQFVGRHPTTADFAKCGFLVKLDTYVKISQASFCGNLFDEDSMQIVTDPLDVISSFGWTTNRYRHSAEAKLKTLLRCKALSFAHQYPGCPMIGKLAQYALRVTRGRTNKDMLNFVERSRDLNLWYREQLIEAIKYRTTDEALYVEPTQGTRILFFELYGVTESMQIMFEKYVDSLEVLQPLRFDLLVDMVPPSWRSYWDKYVVPFDVVPEKYILPTVII